MVPQVWRQALCGIGCGFKILIIFIRDKILLENKKCIKAIMLSRKTNVP